MEFGFGKVDEDTESDGSGGSGCSSGGEGGSFLDRGDCNLEYEFELLEFFFERGGSESYKLELWLRSFLGRVESKCGLGSSFSLVNGCSSSFSRNCSAS